MVCQDTWIMIKLLVMIKVTASALPPIRHHATKKGHEGLVWQIGSNYLKQDLLGPVGTCWDLLIFANKWYRHAERPHCLPFASSMISAP